MNLQIYHVDAFTTKPFHGNPAAVVPLDAWLSPDEMQNIALENNLPATAFFVKAGDGYQIRWFTTRTEIPLCGHATLASAFVLFGELGVTTPSITFSCNAGELHVYRQDDRLVLDFPAIFPDRVASADAVITAIGAGPKEIYKALDYMLIYDDEETIASLEPDFGSLAKTDARGVIVTSPGKTVDIVSRFFAPGFGINEDQVTGSAHCALVPYWAKQFCRNTLTARQLSARGGELFCEFSSDRVKIGGQATLFLKGEIVTKDARNEAASG